MKKKIFLLNKKRDMLRKSVLSACITAITSSLAMAGPEGGQVTGGSGSISNAGNTTTIHQQTDRLAIDWQSYNVGVDERVQYIQPDSSSVSLNRILSNSASSIQGRIDANGQVILVNPHGIMFGENSIVNAGGILASGLSIDTDQFMNGDFTFKEIEGTDGAVAASGVINAASGGSVALIGKSVKNEGLISAELGSVHFAAGREAVITFGESGFIGVRVSDALVEEQMGVDAAVLNSGEINATGGQVLLTASTSRDIFSGVINTGDLEFDRSVVVNNDGSYSLGGGADIANTGSINVSGERGGEVVLIGENVDHSGIIKAESLIAEQGGSVELYSTDTTLLSSDSLISTNALQGVGGDVKILGDHVGLVENSQVISNGQAGGQILIGGDERGENRFVPNATAVFAGENTLVEASSYPNGNTGYQANDLNSNTVNDIASDVKNDGGKVILWGDDYLSAHGEIKARGFDEGNGGFVETSSALVNLNPTVDVGGGESGESGLWLIDPYDITISNGAPQVPDAVGNIFSPIENSSFLAVSRLLGALTGGSSVIVETTGDDNGTQNGDITVNAAINFNGRTNSSLTFQADNNITINENISDIDVSDSNDSLNLTLSASGDITIDSGVDISLEGGNFTASGNDFTNLGSIETGGGDFTFGDINSRGNNFDNQGMINVASVDGGGDIELFFSGDVTELGIINISDSPDDGDPERIDFFVQAENIFASENIFVGFNGSNSADQTNIEFNAVEDIIFDSMRIDNADNEVANTIFLTLNSDTDNNSSGTISVQNAASLFLNGGDFLATGHNVVIGQEEESGNNRIATEGGSLSIGTSADRITGVFNNNFDNAEFTTFRNGDPTGDVSIFAVGNVDIGRTNSTTNNGDNWDYLGEDAVDLVFDSLADLTVHQNFQIDRFTGTSVDNTLTMNAGGRLSINAEIVHSIDSSTFTFVGGSGSFVNVENSDGFVNNAVIDSNGSNITVGSTTGDITLNANLTGEQLNINSSGGSVSQDMNNSVLAFSTMLIADLGMIGSLNLENSFNRIDQIQIVSANNVTFANTGDIDILESTITGNLDLRAVGDGRIRDVGSPNATAMISVGGSSTFTTDDRLIQFDVLINDFGGAVSATGSSVEINDANDFVIGELNLTGNETNTILATGNITHAAGDSISTNGGALDITGGSVQVNDIITEGGLIDITANSNAAPFIALAGDIDSTVAGSDSGLITLDTNGGNIELRDNVTITASTTNFNLNSNIVADEDENAESLTINAQEITLESIMTAATEDGASGGAVTLNGSVITVGEINTSGREGTLATGGDGGEVSLIVTNSGAAEATIRGDINTQGGGGVILSGSNGTATITLANGASSGLVDLSDAGTLTSSITINGSDSDSDVLVGPSGDANVVNWQSNAEGGSFGISDVSDGVSTFNGFETVTGGSGADNFTITDDRISTWNGGEGDDVFNIAAGILTRVYGNISGDDFLGIDDASVNTVSLTTDNGVHDWTITGGGTGDLTDGFSFFLFDNLNGSDGGADRFQLDDTFGNNNTIDARGSLQDSVLVSDSSNPQSISFGEDFSGLLNVEAIEAVGVANDFILQLADGTANNRWTINGVNSGIIVNGDDTTEQISFINFATVFGNSGNDTFSLEGAGSIERIGGGSGTNNTVDFSGLGSNLNLIVDEILGEIDGTIRVTDIQNIFAPNVIENTLTFNSDSDNAYSWTFFDFDGDGVLADGLRDGQIQRTDTTATAINFSNFDILNGGEAQDTFVVNASEINATIDGGGGNDTLQSYDNAILNTWTINNVDAGDLNYSANNNVNTLVAGNINFSEIENLVGADAAPDTFSFGLLGSISGSILAGESTGVIDTVDFSGSNIQEITIGSSVNGVDEVERIIGNSMSVNTLTSNTTYLLWDITDANSGEVFNAGRTDSIIFENFNNVTGTSANDEFTLMVDGSIGEIRGGAGQNSLISEGASRNWFIDEGATASTGRRIEQIGVNVVDSFNGIQVLQGADNFADSFTLAADSDFIGDIFGGTSSLDNQANTFTVLSTASAGTNIDVQWNLLDSGFNVSRSDSTITTNFSNIQNIIGGAGNDSFVIDDAFINSGVMIDGTGTTDRDVFNVAALTDDESILLLDVIATNNAITLEQDGIGLITANNIEAVFGDSQSNLTLQSVFANDWDVQAINSGELTATISGAERTIDFENIINLTGGILADDFDIANGANIMGLLAGGDGANVLTNNNTAQTWTLTDAFAGDVGGATFTGIQTLNANDSILIGRAQNNVWNINRENSGTVALDDTASTDRIIFTGMNSLYGNTGSDNFIVATAGSITEEIQGTFPGGENTNNDRLEVMSASGDAISWDVNESSSVTRVEEFSLIENLVGGAGDDNFTISGLPFALNINGGANTEVVDENFAGDVITWNVSGLGADVRLSNSEQRIRGINNGTSDVVFDDIEVVFGNNGEQDRFTILGGNVAQVRGRDGADTFIIDNNENDDINIRLFGGGGGSFDDVLVGANRENTWIFDSQDESFSTLNAIDTNNQGIMFDSAFQTFRGGNLDDNFIYVSGNEIPNIDGGLSGVNGNTLEVERAAGSTGQTDWIIDGENSGSVAGIVDGFSNIQNLTGGLGEDEFNITVGSTLSGLIDGRDNTVTDTIEDTFDVGNLNAVVVVIGDDGTARPFVDGAEDSPYFNVIGFESIVADDLNPETDENNRWIVVNSDRNINWDFTSSNSGTVVELAGPMDSPIEEDALLIGTQFSFENFGNAQGGAGVDNTNNENNLTGIFNPLGGGRNLSYDSTVDLAVVFITPDILMVTGTDGNVVLRVAPDDLIEEANFNGENEWTISGENSGDFLASYFDNGEDDTGFSFEFWGVNRIEGGAGNDVFNFIETGALIDGYINGGGGVNTITLSNNHSLGLDFGLSTLNTEATDLSGENTVVFPINTGITLPELFELDNRNGVIDVLNITSITAEASSLRTEALRIRSAETGNFSWNFEGQLTDTDNGTVLSYTGFDEVQGGSGNDLFELTTDLILGYQLDGGDGQDIVDLSAFTNVSVDLDPLEGDFIGIEAYEGNNTNSELLAADGLNIWTIDGVNQGSVLNSGETIRFTGFNTLQGGSGRDDITITQGGIRGDIFGNDGDDELNVQLGFTDETLSSGATEAVNFVGGAGNNTVNVSGGSNTNRFAGDYTPTVLVGTSGDTEQQTFNFSFEQANSAQNTEIVLTNVNNIVEQVFTSAMTVNSVRGQSDIIRVSDGFIQVGDFSEVSASNNASLIVDGEISDQLLIVGDINVADEFVVNNASVSLEDNPLEGVSFTINANSAVRFNNNDQVGEADNRINLATPNLSLNGISGDTYLLSNSNLNIDQLNAPGGVVDIISRGNITDSATLNSLQNIVLASDDDIILDNENLLTGLITLSAQNVTLNNGTTNLGDTSAQNFTLTTRANVIDQGVLTISGTTSINAQENSAITLDNINNAFNQVTVNNTGSVILVDGSDDGVSVSGSAAAGYSVTADGIIISNGLEAGMIELISSNNDILVQDTINAETALTLSGNNITVNGITNVGGETATNSATTFSADNVVQLNAAVLGNADNNEMNITAGSVLQSAGANLSAQNLIIETSGAQTLLGNTLIGNNFNSISGSSFTMNSGAVIAEIIANNITISAQDNVVTQSLTGETIELSSASGDIEQQENITTDTININALSGNFNSSNGAILTLNQGVSTLDAIDATLGGSIVGDGSLIINLANQFSQSGNIALGNVEVNANNIAMDSNSDISGTSGVMLNALQNIELASVSSQELVSLIAGGAVVDNNGVATNVTGNSLFARSEMGFGEPGISGNTIETSVGNIDVQNDLNGIGLVNNGDVSVTSLISNSDILFQNDNGNVILANSDSGSYDLDATDAREAGGVINANYDFGRLTLVVSDGFLDATPAAFVERPELVGDIVEVSTTEGFGVTRRIVVFARTEAIVSGRGIEPFFGFNTPPELGLTTDTDLLSLTDVSSAAELLVEVEDLQDINPAVFTDIRNFAFGNISIRMPRDQLYDYGVYEEEDDALDERF